MKINLIKVVVFEKGQSGRHILFCFVLFSETPDRPKESKRFNFFFHTSSSDTTCLFRSVVYVKERLDTKFVIVLEHFNS